MKRARKRKRNLESRIADWNNIKTDKKSFKKPGSNQ
jgi:hypothetical protein